MAQFARPTSDLDNTGSWTTEPLWSDIDDGASADGTVVVSDSTPVVTEPFTVDLGSTITDPGVGTGHVLRIRWAKNAGGGGNMTIRIELREGYVNESTLGSLRATDDYAINSTTLTTDATTMSEAEANAITDYSDLQIRVMGVAATRALKVDFVELETPDGPLELVAAVEAAVETGATPTQTHTLNAPIVAAVENTATPKQVHKLGCPAAAGGFSSGFSSGFDVSAGGGCVSAAAEVAGVLTVVAIHELVAATATVVEAAGGVTQTHKTTGQVEATVEAAGVLTVSSVNQLVGAVEAAAENTSTSAQTHNTTGGPEAAVEVVGVLTIGNRFVGAAEAVAKAVGVLTVSGDNLLVGAVEAAAEVDGTVLTVTSADLFVGWGIPAGVS